MGHLISTIRNFITVMRDLYKTTSEMKTKYYSGHIMFSIIITYAAVPL